MTHSFGPVRNPFQVPREADALCSRSPKCFARATSFRTESPRQACPEAHVMRQESSPVTLLGDFLILAPAPPSPARRPIRALPCWLAEAG